MDAVPVVLFWGLAIWGFLSRGPGLIYLFFATMPFSAFAVVPPSATAGLTFTPTPIVALLIILRVLGNREGIDFSIASALSLRRLGLIFAFWVVAVMATLFMPRLFAGQVEVIPVAGANIEPLRPTMQNISQLAYMTISVATVFAFARLMESAVMRQHALRALCLGAAVAITTGMLDLASEHVPLDWLLEPFRTAAYTLRTDDVVLGAKRIVGLTPEASAFGGLCLRYLSAVYFCRFAIMDDRLRNRYVPLLCGLLFLFAYLSTSSAALVGLAVFGLMAAMEWAWRAAVLAPGSRRLGAWQLQFWGAATALAGLLLVVLIAPKLLDPFIRMVNDLILQKSSSQSFAQRSQWTAVSWRALVQSFGMGVGLGGTRASNAAVAIISNVGVIGAAFYAAFVVQSIRRRAWRGNVEAELVLSGVRWALWPGFVVGLLVGTVADFGTFVAFLFGLACAAAEPPRSAAHTGDRVPRMPAREPART